LRLEIVTSFAKDHIRIAFPQRDLHLDSLRPIQVEVVPVNRETRPSANHNIAYK